ncbi:MAG TPA: hypothetical protein VMT43_01015 [Acidimicrobiales bacterium]|nr:hypothetical protein [Acidimicrobiales bacterium]
MLTAVLLVAGCTGSTSHGPSSATTSIALGPTGPEGTDCLTRLHRATVSTLGAPSLTLVQAAWHEQPAGATVSGGGAAVVTYQAPDRYHVVPATGSGHASPVEQLFVGRRAWQGSARDGWVRYTSHHPSDPLRWLRVPARATRASWAGDSCTFSATVPEGAVRGRAQIDADGHLLTLDMTLTAQGHTIRMAYRVEAVGSSPPITTPRT